VVDEVLPWHEPDPTLESWAGEIVADPPWLAFPIGPLGPNPDGTLTIDRQFGTCFFISSRAFLTAWHVVEDPIRSGTPLSVVLFYGSEEEPRGLAVELVERVERVIGPDGRAVDIGLGLIRPLPPGKMVPRIPLSTRLVPDGARVAAFGYAQSQWHETANEVGPPDLAMNVTPRFNRGGVVEYVSQGRGNSRWPHYVHDAETRGGISGGPLIDISSGTVCGVNSTGIDNTSFSTAVDIRVALDWAIPFANGRTLRSFGAEGVVDLR
jgi:hypothetical protein